jgi:hypothetical protein
MPQCAVMLTHLLPLLRRYWVSKGERKGANPMSVSGRCCMYCCISRLATSRRVCLNVCFTVSTQPQRNYSS